jgi:serine protease
MKQAFRRRLVLSTLAAVSLCAAAALPDSGVERGPQRKVSATATAAPESEARVIVKYRADSSLMRPLSAGGAPAGPQHAQALSTRMGLSLVNGRMLGSHSQVVKSRGISSQELADRLAAQGDVEYAVVDGRKRALAAPSDPLYASGQTGSVPPSGQWYLRAPTSATIVDSTSIVSAINAQGAWGVTTGSSSVVVADLDTGVRFDHPDLTTKLLQGYDFIHNAANANDNSAADTDASDPGDFVTSADVGVVPGCTSSDVGDSSWHGTQTAGLIGAATDNGVGMASVGRNVMVQPLRVLGKCGGYDSDIQAAIQWAAGIAVPGVPTNQHPAKVINMSLGASGACDKAYSDVIAQANAAGVVVVVAAGNDGLDVGSPANCAGAIGVAGVRHSGTKVGYSDLGPTVAIAAPAGNCGNSSGTCLYPLLTTSNSGTTTPVAGAAGAIYTGNGNDASLGTSFSAPLVSGTVALMFSANPNLTPAQVKAALQSSARAFPSSGAAPSQRTVGGPFVPVSACAAPTATAQDYECYCTTSTCGAGLLDASAAVSAVAVTMANPKASPTSVVAGASVTLDGSASTASTGNTISSYYWSIPSDTTIASLTSNGASATLQTTAAGSVVVSLTVTDSAGAQNTNTITVTIAAAPTPTPTPSSGGGGGGAMSLGWLLGWLACVVGVWVVTPRLGRRR